MEQAHSAGAASSTGSLERASLFCASGSTTTSSSGLSSPVEHLTKSKSSSRFSLFSPPWNSMDISDLPDTVQEGLALKHRCFDDINECIDASMEKRKRVLVHCRDGFSLAPTCIIQYLMVKQNMRLIAAYELLRAKHPVNIRESHQNVLVSLERALRPGGNTDPDLI
uniref:protein-tyrosine-phosphatase n=1 Tax=Cyprinus carpio TaxID=7962 RepID=A0A8C1PP73_CYPCA